MPKADHDVMLNQSRHLLGVPQLSGDRWSLRARTRGNDAIDRGTRRGRAGVPERAVGGTTLEAKVGRFVFGDARIVSGQPAAQRGVDDRVGKRNDRSNRELGGRDLEAVKIDLLVGVPVVPVTQRSDERRHLPRIESPRAERSQQAPNIRGGTGAATDIASELEGLWQRRMNGHRLDPRVGERDESTTYELRKLRRSLGELAEADDPCAVGNRA